MVLSFECPELRSGQAVSAFGSIRGQIIGLLELARLAKRDLPDALNPLLQGRLQEPGCVKATSHPWAEKAPSSPL